MSVNRISVDVHGPHNLEKALSIFKSKVQRSGILEQYKENQYYTKPSEARRERMKKAKKLQKENL